MKMRVSGHIIFKLLLFIMVIPELAIAQRADTGNVVEKSTLVRNLVTSGDYVFRARTALPMSGRARHLTSDYDLIISTDTVRAYLPYFGRAYSAPIDPSKGGIQFISTQFSYTITDRKKGGWRVLIKPGDIRDVQQLTLTISPGGYATLQVISNRRQPISFNGRVSKR